MWKFVKNYGLLLLMAGGFIVLVVLMASVGVQPQKLAETPLQIQSQDGSTAQDFTVEVARSHEETLMGLMFRKEMPARHGMIFIFPEDKVAEFWMKNTLIPLDMIFIGSDGEIKHIHPMAKPLDTTLISSIAKVKAVLELNGGEAQALGIMIGDRVLHAELGQAVP